MNVKFLDLQRENARFAPLLKEAAARVIDRGWYLLGEETQRLESNIEHTLGLDRTDHHITTCANGLDALRMILRAYIINGTLSPGDEVLVPANTFIASVLAITDNGLIPRFVDPSSTTYLIDLPSLEAAITPQCKALIVVHLFGRICWNDELATWAASHHLTVIEDAAQAFGTYHQGLPAGALGDAAAFSFYPAKNLGALGDAGAVCTADKELTETIRTLRNYGSSVKYINDHCGFNSRIDEIQAAMINVKLPHLLEDNRRRKSIASLYNRLINHPDVLKPIVDLPDDEHSWHLYVIRIDQRDELKDYLTQNGVETSIHYPIPPHLQPCYTDYAEQIHPNAEYLSIRILSLPIGASMTEEEVHHVASAINRFPTDSIE